LADPASADVGSHGEIVEVTALAVRAEHHHAEQALAIAGQPETLAPVAGGNHLLENITGRPRETDFQQGLELLPRG
jgi:hypothetical protein